MFTSLRELWKRARQGSTPSPEKRDRDVAALRGLAASAEWQLFLQSLDGAVNFNAEQLLSPSAPSETIHFLRGKIAGLRQSGTLVDEILAHARSRDAAERAISTQRSDTAALTFASPFHRTEKSL